MLSRKSCAMVEAVNGWSSGTKCAYLLNLSTTTMTQSAVLKRGSPSMKSIEITCHDSVGTGRGESNPGYLAWSGLACKHLDQEATKAFTSVFIPVQVKSFQTRAYVTGKPECPRSRWSGELPECVAAEACWCPRRCDR